MDSLQIHLPGIAPRDPLCAIHVQATDGAERAADVIFKINDFLDTTKLGLVIFLVICDMSATHRISPFGGWARS